LANDHRIANHSAALNRITPESSSLTRRLAAVVISIWFGGILLVALAAPAAFRSVDNVLTAPPESVAKALKSLGPSLTREILRYQASESNRLLFDTWGWVQLGLGLAVVILLLFLRHAKITAISASAIPLTICA
jgi:hypothetical protein